MTDVLEEFNNLQKAVVELDNMVLEKSDQEIDFQLTRIKSSLADVKFSVSGDSYKELFKYLDEFLRWTELHLRSGKRTIIKSNIVTATEFLSNMRTRLLAQDKIEKEKALLALNNVFIVHGRDHDPMKELKTMLLEFDLNPIVLHEQPGGSRTIVERLERHSDVGYAFVILTPDDAGALGRSFARLLNALRRDFFRYADIDANSRAERNLRKMHSLLKRRARQNVVLEFGYFIGLLGRDRVCCLLKGTVEKPSDMEGIVYVAFKRSVNEVRHMIIKELKEAGYEIRLQETNQSVNRR